MLRKFILISFALSSMTLSSFVTADEWQLDLERSSLNFASVKNDHIEELHSFEEFRGSWNDGQLMIEIPVTSLETGIPIRNERMLKHLFDSENYPLATASATIPEDAMSEMAIGETYPLSVDLEVSIANSVQEVTASVLVTKTGVNDFKVTTAAPLMIDTKDFGLVSGVNQLIEIAGLERIDYVIPVTFNTHFTRQIQ